MLSFHNALVALGHFSGIKFQTLQNDRVGDNRSKFWPDVIGQVTSLEIQGPNICTSGTQI